MSDVTEPGRRGIVLPLDHFIRSSDDERLAMGLDDLERALAEARAAGLTGWEDAIFEYVVALRDGKGLNPPMTDPMTGTARAEVFIDGVSRRHCTLVIDPAKPLWDGGAVVQHPDCEHPADVSVDLDCFYCQSCRWNGRISGAWAYDLYVQSQEAIDG